MKRVLIISLIFGAAFCLLCLMGCGGPSGCRLACDSLTVDTYNHQNCSCSPDEAAGETELTGCHIANSCIDCYWFPSACGYYENDLGSSSRVVCGWDCTFGECYGDSSLNQAAAKSDLIPNEETRTTVAAQENVDYTIDNIGVSLYYGEIETFEELNFELDELWALIGTVSMWGEDTQIQITVEYTALTELSGVLFEGDVIYDGYEWTNYTDGFRVTDGNDVNATTKQKQYNLQPGKHVVSAVISLNFYEMTDLEDITNIEFSAYKYAEG